MLGGAWTGRVPPTPQLTGWMPGLLVQGESRGFLGRRPSGGGGCGPQAEAANRVWGRAEAAEFAAPQSRTQSPPGCRTAGGAVVSEMWELLAGSPGRGSLTTAPEPGGARVGSVQGLGEQHEVSMVEKNSLQAVFSQRAHISSFFFLGSAFWCQKAVISAGVRKPQAASEGLSVLLKQGYLGGLKKPFCWNLISAVGSVRGLLAGTFSVCALFVVSRGKGPLRGLPRGLLEGPCTHSSPWTHVHTCTCEPACACHHAHVCVCPHFVPEFLGVPCKRSPGFRGTPVSP